MRLPRLARPERPALALMIGLLAVLTVHAAAPFGNVAVDEFFSQWLNSAVCVAPGIFVLGRVVRVSRERTAWALIGSGLLLWGIGNVYYLFALTDLDPIPIPSIADALWIVFYLLSYAGLLMLMRSRITESRMLRSGRCS